MSRLLQIALAAVLLTSPSQAGDAKLQLAKDRSVEVIGLDSHQIKVLKESEGDWPRIFVVRVDQAESASRPSIVGTYELQADRLTFRPRFPFESGLRYEARLESRGLLNFASTAPTRLVFEIPSPPEGPRAQIERVAPTDEVLPENLLKFYLHFSQPMARGEVYERVHLLNSKREAIVVPFLELGEELWNPSGTRVTILFDPGRIKQGLKPREELGPVLEAGHTYTLVIDQGWPDAQGRPLQAGYQRIFKTKAADTTSPDPRSWRIVPPSRGTREPLQIEFNESLDSALLVWTISVKDNAGTSLSGQIDVAVDGRSWKFTPEIDWTSGTYSLNIKTILEDLAGNSIARTFEVDQLRTVERRIEAEVVERRFIIK